MSSGIDSKISADYSQSSAADDGVFFLKFGSRVREAGATPALPRNCERRSDVVRPLWKREGRAKIQSRKPGDRREPPYQPLSRAKEDCPVRRVFSLSLF